MKLKDKIEGDLDKQWAWGGIAAGKDAWIDRMDTEGYSEERKA